MVDIASLIPAKIAVEASIGKLWVRSGRTSDWTQFGNRADAIQLGRGIVRQLTSRDEDKHSVDALSDDDAAALNDGDYELLALAAIKRNGWERFVPPVNDGPVPALGRAFKAEQLELRAERQKLIEDAQKLTASNYSFLSDKVLDKLQDQVGRLASARTGMPSSSAIDQLLKSVTSPATGDLERLFTASTTRLRTPEILSPTMIRPFRPEESKLGKATIEAAAHARETAERMEALASAVGELHQTFLNEVIPTWFGEVKSGQTATKDQLRKASVGLWLTGAGLLVSAVVAVGIAVWQVNDTHKGDEENAARAKRTEVLMREQLEAQRRLIDQQARDAASLRATLEEQGRAMKAIESRLQAKR